MCTHRNNRNMNAQTKKLNYIYTHTLLHSWQAQTRNNMCFIELVISAWGSIEWSDCNLHPTAIALTHTHKLTHKQTNKQTNKQTHTNIHIHTHTLHTVMEKKSAPKKSVRFNFVEEMEYRWTVPSVWPWRWGKLIIWVDRRAGQSSDEVSVRGRHSAQ